MELTRRSILKISLTGAAMWVVSKATPTNAMAKYIPTTADYEHKLRGEAATNPDVRRVIVGPLVDKFTWLLDNVEVKGIVRWIDPVDANGTQPDQFGIQPDSNYQHLISIMPGNNPLLYQTMNSIGTLVCETYPLVGGINRSDPWHLPKKPGDQPFRVIANRGRGETARPMAVGDHVRVIGRLVIDHHPEWCDKPGVHPAGEPSRCHSRGWLKVGPAHMELHPIRWDDIQLVTDVPPSERVSEIVSLAAPVHEEVYVGDFKHFGNWVAGVESKIFIQEDGSNYHNQITAVAHIKAPAIPGFTPHKSLIAFQEYVRVNGTGLNLSQNRTVEVLDDGIKVVASVDAPRTEQSGGLTYADVNDPANGRSILQLLYEVWWQRRLQFVNEQGDFYEVDNPFNIDIIQMALKVPSIRHAPFLLRFNVLAKNRGPDSLRINRVHSEGNAAFQMDAAADIEVPAGGTVHLRGTLRTLVFGTFSATIVVSSTDPGHERLAIGIKTTVSDGAPILAPDL
jgi:hypothetical protein